MTVKERIMKYIPKTKKKAVTDAWHDEDGYWVLIGNGWKLDGYYGTHVIHEDTITDIRRIIPMIVKE